MITLLSAYLGRGDGLDLTNSGSIGLLLGEELALLENGFVLVGDAAL
jgi:hypothetical protein